MKVEITVSEAILEWILASIRLESLPEKTSQQLIQWYHGEKTPTFNQIEEVSKATGIPFGYFFLKTPPTEDLSLLEYRTLDSLELQKPSRNLVDTIRHMEQIQDWVKEELMRNGSQPLEFVGQLSENDNVGAFVSQIHTLLALSDDWFSLSHSADDSFKLIRNRISNLGVVVMMSGIVGNNTHRPLAIDEFRAFAIVNEYAPLFLLILTIPQMESSFLFCMNLHIF